MKDFDPWTSFGAQVASGYDENPRGDEEATVACLRELAGEGPALELAIGTGRIALPLAATGVRVDGIEQSAAMIEVLRAKPGGSELHVVQGDMADIALPGSYRLAFLVFNSIFNLLTQDQQVACFASVADHLDDDGRFLIEAALPGPGLAEPGPQYRLDQNYVEAESIETDQVTLDVGRYDPSTQILDRTRVHLSAAGVKLSPIALRFAGPGELDLMARLAGLRLHARWGGWQREPFTATSRRHVSLYGH